MRTPKSNKNWFALKLDLGKAFDKLEWSFIRNCLAFFRFDEHSIVIVALGRKTSLLTYSLSRVTKIFAPIRIVHLIKNRYADKKK
ncbi:hypothetical protein RND81_02G102600 [Saponaria officinalis]|uniref:Reverse transcriptase domain-containing protein n=1 Tax=Saponaria officinalis TaxID=3572 RepID=A0AAW1MPG2_SAPOF